MSKTYTTKQELFGDALILMDKSLRDIMNQQEIKEAEINIKKYGKNRKGYLGNLVEKYAFGSHKNSEAMLDRSFASTV